MQSKTGPQQGINSWLEEELLQQYRHDRGSVDADWKNIFEHNGSNGVTAVSTTVATNGATQTTHGNGSTPAALMTRPVELTGTEELMPLRGAPARIAENMAASASIPLATSQRIIAGQSHRRKPPPDQSPPRPRSARARFPTRTSSAGRSCAPCRPTPASITPSRGTPPASPSAS